MNEKLKNNSNKNIKIKQVLAVIFFVLIIAIGIYVYTNNKYNENNINTQPTISSYTLDTIPEYSTEPYVTINNNIPNFDEKYFTTDSFEIYSDLDEYGRCGVAFANLKKI